MIAMGEWKKTGLKFVVLSIAVFLGYCFSYADSWQGPAQIDSGSSNAYSPQIATGPGGSAVSAFMQVGVDSLRIYANRYDGTGWEGATAIDADVAYDAYAPRVAIGGDGTTVTAVVIFRQYQKDVVSGDYYFRIYASWCKYDVVTTTWGLWSSAAPIDNGGYSAGEHQIAVHSDGTAISVFSQRTGRFNQSRVYANVFNGTGWGSAQPIDILAGICKKEPKIAFASNGNAIVLFQQFENYITLRMYANRYISGTGWEVAQTIDSGDYYASEHRLAVSGNTAIAIFNQYVNNTDTRIHARVHDADGFWSWTPAQAIDDAGISNDSVNKLRSFFRRPEISFNGDTAIAVFNHFVDSVRRLYANVYNAGTWGTPQAIDANTGFGAFEPAIALGNNNSGIVVFASQIHSGYIEGTNNRVYANVFNGTSWGSAQPIDATLNNYYGFGPRLPRVTAFGDISDNSFTAISIFSQFDAADLNFRVFANRYFHDGTGWVWEGAQKIDDPLKSGAYQPQIVLGSDDKAIAVFTQYDDVYNRAFVNVWE